MELAILAAAVLVGVVVGPSFAQETAPAPVPAPAVPAPVRVAVLNFGPPPEWQGKVDDIVGIEITAKAFEEAVPLLEKDGVKVVVLRVNSGGGLTDETKPLVRVFEEQYRPRFRTVAWIDEAINAAAAGVNGIEEMYFAPDGYFGAASCQWGPLWALRCGGLEEYIVQQERASALAHRSPFIMRSMQVLDAPLSYTVDKDTGAVTWFQDVSGDNVLNDGKHILTLNAADAVKCKFARGIAATPEALMQVMGIAKYELAGKEAADLIDESMKKADAQTKQLSEVTTKYRLALGAASQFRGPESKDRRIAEVGRARNYLNQIRAASKVNPNFEWINGLTPEWFEEQERILRELMKN